MYVIAWHGRLARVFMGETPMPLLDAYLKKQSDFRNPKCKRGIHCLSLAYASGYE